MDIRARYKHRYPDPGRRVLRRADHKPDHGMTLEEQHRLRKTKERHKALAADCHARLTHLTRIKIAWAISQFPEECLLAAAATLHKKLARGSDAPHKEWKRMLAEKDLRKIKQTLLNQTKRLQELNSCHPFGHALQIYEKHHARRHR